MPSASEYHHGERCGVFFFGLRRISSCAGKSCELSFDFGQTSLVLSRIHFQALLFFVAHDAGVSRVSSAIGTALHDTEVDLSATHVVFKAI